LTAIIKSRLAATRARLSDQSLDALLVSGADNRRYLSGFTAREEICHESCGSLLITRDEALLLTDFRYQEWAQAEVSEFDVLIYQAGLGALLIEQLGVLPGDRLGFESAYLSCGQHQRLTKAAAEAGLRVEWVPTEGLVEGLREVKHPEEILLVRQALALTEKVFSKVAASLRPGLTERQVAWEIERRLREGGAAGLAFSPIVAAGANSARPHHRPGDYPLQAGEPIIIDMGARISGYCADLTRTVILGEVTERFREIATMKCLGATDGFIMVNFMLESAVQGVAGGVVGSLLGLILGTLLSWKAYGLMSLAHLPIGDVALAAGISLVLGVVLSILAAVYPAWVAARLAPMEAMRIE